ncbi:predicted protein [Plenodomus lingam JN3]|uniref:Predicted protein n=1 Tax=Leptosphaeria maculans (strain JN3 / isolate v23.1.3 / race Av1-4-5-6-7-8) TaxID=985895 RepID=E5A2K3_LEPMJ|nr:predicted protein [Plenodomus lingam JN3]CBX97799.1 predicted protein [Plenodomus lingam JN3]
MEGSGIDLYAANPVVMKSNRTLLSFKYMDFSFIIFSIEMYQLAPIATPPAFQAHPSISPTNCNPAIPPQSLEPLFRTFI